jgi:hypothetical protein
METPDRCLGCEPLSVEASGGKGLVSGVDTMARSEGVGICAWKLSRTRLDSIRRV